MNFEIGGMIFERRLKLAGLDKDKKWSMIPGPVVDLLLSCLAFFGLDKDKRPLTKARKCALHIIGNTFDQPISLNRPLQRFACERIKHAVTAPKRQRT